ncbi:MAG: undecaprenyl-diphosphate phosphatase [Rhodospirillaceae bacterium]|nr:undecaprenyl-diphosphate phosphatase [Rhodospirillaceae bacterium]
MPLIQILVLALIQGLTEFLPVSSSGHLILVPALTGWKDQGLAVDVAAHVGTLVAVLIYFWRDVGRMLSGIARLFVGRFDPGAKLAAFLLLGTIPALGAGYLIDEYAGDLFRRVEIVAWTLIGFGILLWVADRIGLTIRRVEHMTLAQALFVGFAQALAFIPGTSRSGITMTAARLVGFERQEAARFSFLLAIPAISAAGLWKGYELYETGSTAQLEVAAMTAAFCVLTGLFAIAFMMQWLKRANFTPFVIYRLLLGGLLLYLVYVEGWWA